MSEEGATAFETSAQDGHAKVNTTQIHVKPSVGRRAEVTQRVIDRFIPQDFAGIVRGEKPEGPAVPPEVAYVLNELMVGPWRLERQTSTVSR